MKFAVLALIGAVSATEETELVGKMWRWKHIPKIMEQEMRVKDAFEDVEDDLEDAFEKIGESLDGKFEKYIPELEAWGQSKVVLAKKAHDKKMMESDMGQEFLRSLEQVGEDATTVHWASGFDQDGYKEWIKNEDLAMMFEEDMGVENHDQLMAKLHKMGMKIAMKMHKCKKMQKLFKALERLIVMAERTKEVFDMPNQKDVEAWWNEHDFQPWI